MGGSTNFLAGFMNSFGNAAQAQQDRQQRKQFTDLQVKAFKTKLEADQAKEEYKRKFAGLMAPSEQPPAELGGGPAKPGQSVLQMLTNNPEGELAGLMSGLITPKDIGLAQDRLRQQQFSQQLLGGPGAQGAQGGQGARGDLGWTPQSKQIYGQTFDPKDLVAIKPEKIVRQMKDGPHTVLVNPYTEEIVSDLGPVKEEKLATGEAGKISSIQFATDSLNTAINMLAPGGQVDSKIVAQMALPSSTQWGPAREITQLINEAITTKVLIQSGVTARPDEIKATAQRFIPTPLDLTQPGLAERKLKRLQEFMQGALDYTTLPPSLKKRIEAKRKSKEKPSLNMNKKSSPNVVNFEDLP